MFSGLNLTAQTTVTIGSGSSSSSTRGPFQRSDTASSTVYSRFFHVYTAAELAAAGITSGVSIDEVKWELASSNVIIGSGNANIKIYVKNSTATSASADTWSNLISGATMVLDEDYNTTNNFPGANGWMGFDFTTPITYTGGALEIAVDWDCSQVSTPAFSGDGALKWRWESTSPDTLVVKKTSSSSPSSNISDHKTERANIQIVYSSAACAGPSAIHATPGDGSAQFTWVASTGATSYNWKVVAAGAGSSAMAVDSGSTSNTLDSSMTLGSMMAYDLYVEADCGSGGSGYTGPFSFFTQPASTTELTVGAGTSSSSTRGPFQRSDTNSTTVYSRFVHVYTAAELAAAGLTSGTDITSLNWELASSNQVIGMGNAELKVYIKNSTATAATADSWTNLISGSTMVVDYDFNTANNFPGANGWMPFYFSAPFTYTGGAIEIAVDWDCSQVSSPAFSGDGSLKWRWESTAPDDLVVKKTSSSSPSSTISDLRDERANIQFVFAGTTPSCDAPTGLSVTNIGDTTADLEWSSSANATSYFWKIVNAGAGSSATAVDSAMTVDTTASTNILMEGTSYDLFVQSDCGANGMSSWAGPFNFTTTSSIGLDKIEYLTNLSISPNPTQGVVRLDIELARNADVAIAVLSITGELLMEYPSVDVNTLQKELDLSMYDDGLYFILVSFDNQITTNKIILLK
ncbi:MAG: hypothetical protein SchgKO_00490 [Schleiferiaceae bacterium]